MIADTITKKIAEALKARDEVRLSTLRMLSSALNYEKIAKQHDLSEEEETAVVMKEAKKRKDAIEALEQAQGKLTAHTQTDIQERINKEKEELKILQEYLPEEMDESVLVNLVDQVIKDTGAKEVKDMGKVIGEVMKRAKGRADGGKVAEMVRSRLL